MDSITTLMMPDPGQDTILCLQMTVGFRDSIGMFLFSGWDAGRKTNNFGLYFATLIFVATLCFVVEAVPFIRSILFKPISKRKNYSEINKSQTT